MDNLQDIEYKMFVHPNTMVKSVTTISSEPDSWFYATMVWSVGSPFKIYEDGSWIQDGILEQDGIYGTDINTERKLAFGIPYTSQTYDFGTAYIDAVKMFNRPLTTEEVQALYNTYT